MADRLEPYVRVALLRRVCCVVKPNGPGIWSAARAHWELSLVVFNTTDEWPHHKWPASRRHQPPTGAERTEALARFGYAPAPSAEWEWQETETPGYHGHPVGVSFVGTLNVVPLEPAQTADGDGERR